MPENVITVENLSKRYILGHERHDTLRDHLTHGLQWLSQGLRGKHVKNTSQDEFWALQDINFSVQKGEVLGIIGRNGAGKSTLLKILSRITEPTTGSIGITGRVASLLEVGTGFHPELSGRDNIFLNGAILGMSKNEIRKKFDEIVAFAEIERFLDTPVKRYSSGMYVRLAFAVAAHLEPEILIVDEVLAVGDAQFQKKCLGKLKDIAGGGGRTVIFVSHDMSSISALTSHCLLLDRGRLALSDVTNNVVSKYLSQSLSSGNYQAPQLGPTATIASISVINPQTAGIQPAGEPMAVEITLHHPEPILGACLSFQIFNQFGQPATHSWIYNTEAKFATKPGTTKLVCSIPKLHLNVGNYTITAHFSEPPGGAFFAVVENVCPFEVIRANETVLWGWRPNACVYHEDVSWSIYD